MLKKLLGYNRSIYMNSDVSRIQSNKSAKILIDSNMYANRDMIINCSIR